MQREESTTTLLDILKNTDEESIKDYENSHLKNQFSSFVSYMDYLIEKSHMKRQDIILKADLPQKYGYKLLTGESHTTDRDKLLRIFIAMKLNLKEVQKALSLYGLATLYPKIKRDAIFIIIFNKEIDDVNKVNELLLENNEMTLTESR